MQNILKGIERKRRRQTIHYNLMISNHMDSNMINWRSKSNQMVQFKMIDNPSC